MCSTHLTVAECLRIARARLDRPSLFSRSGVIRLPPAAYRTLVATGLDQKLDSPAGILSHGLKQALELAMVLALEARIILLDEPTAGLTKEERAVIGGILKDLVKVDGLCVLLVEHDLDFVRQISSRVVVLHQGKILLDGSVDEVVEFQPGQVDLFGRRPSSGADMTTPVLRVKSLDSGYAEATVLHAVDFELQRGEIFGLLGKNGMGKSTLLKCIMGFLPKTAGQVELDGRDISTLPPHLIARAGVGYVAQEKALFQDLTVEENIRLSVRDRPIGVALGEIEDSFPFLLKRLAQRAGTLSGGEQKMLLIARCVANGSRLLLIDEISEGLQPSVIERVASILTNLVKQKGTAVLLVEQNIAFATQVAVRYAVLERGEIVNRGYASDPNASGHIAGYFSV